MSLDQIPTFRESPESLPPESRTCDIPDPVFGSKQMGNFFEFGAPGKNYKDPEKYREALRTIWRHVLRIALNGPLPPSEKQALAMLMGHAGLAYLSVVGDLENARAALKDRQKARTASELRQKIQHEEKRLRRIRVGAFVADSEITIINVIGRLKEQLGEALSAAHAWLVFRTQTQHLFDAEKLIAELETERD